MDDEQGLQCDLRSRKGGERGDEDGEASEHVENSKRDGSGFSLNESWELWELQWVVGAWDSSVDSLCFYTSIPGDLLAIWTWHACSGWHRVGERYPAGVAAWAEDLSVTSGACGKWHQIRVFRGERVPGTVVWWSDGKWMAGSFT